MTERRQRLIQRNIFYRRQFRFSVRDNSFPSASWSDRHGTRNLALSSRRADPNHYSSRPVLSLSGFSAANAIGLAAVQQVTGNGDEGADFTDMLFRSDRQSPAGSTAAHAEIGRIFAKAIPSGALSDFDKTYAARVVAADTGLSQADAEKRVADTFDQAKSAAAQTAETAKKAADAARATGIHVSLWGFISLLVGAFAASFMAVVGGRQRQELA